MEAASQALAQAESGKQQQQAHISELEAQAQSFRAERARIQEEIEDEKGVILTHVAVWHGIKQMLSRFGPEGGATAACCYTCATWRAGALCSVARCANLLTNTVPTCVRSECRVAERGGAACLTADRR